MTLPENVVCVRIFGSMARGDYDSLSDADVLVVVRDRSGKVPEQAIFDCLEPIVRRPPSISWYGRKRLGEMFKNGHLFAWHLFNESISVFGPNNIEELFGRPLPYRDALTDIRSFETIFDGIPNAIRICPQNAIYELGLLYVCVRNIAMSASWHLCGQPNFSRYAPFEVGHKPLTLTVEEYEHVMSCRMASQRGTPIAFIPTQDTALRLCDLIVPWLKGLREELEDNAQ